MTDNMKSQFFPDCFHRVAIKALVVKEGKVLLIKEFPEPSGQWEIPGGGLDFGEGIHECLRREVEEEMGVKVKSIEERPMYVWTWRYENQRNMDWYHSLVVGYKVELESFDFKITEECKEIGWFSKEELEGIELCWQVNGLKKVFNPEDFK